MSSNNGQWPPGGGNGWPGAPDANNAGGGYGQQPAPSPYGQPPMASNQGGWAPQPQQTGWPAPAPAGWTGQPNQAMAPFGQGFAAMPGSGAQQALGVTLEPGERVIFYLKPSFTGDKVALWILGVILLVVVIGIFIILWAIFYEKTQPKGCFVTNRRLVSVDRSGVPMSIALGDIADLEAVRNSGQAYGGGLLGMAIGAIADHMTNKNTKTDPNYWKRAIAVIAVTRDGARVNVPSRKAADLGLFLARTLSMPGSAEQAPSVPVEG